MNSKSGIVSFVVAVVLFSASVSFAIPTSASPSSAKACREITNSMSQFKKTGIAWAETTLAKKDVPIAIELLKGIPFPTVDQASGLVATLESSDIKTNANFFLEVGSDCAAARLRGARVLASTFADSKTSPADREVIKSTLRGLLQIPKYPTALNAAVEMATLNLIVKNKIWSLSAEQMKTMHDLEKQIKINQTETVAKSAPLWEKMDTRTESALAKGKGGAATGAKTSESELIRQMMDTQEFAELKPALIREVKDASKHLAAIRALDLALR